MNKVLVSGLVAAVLSLVGGAQARAADYGERPKFVRVASGTEAEPATRFLWIEYTLHIQAHMDGQAMVVDRVFPGPGKKLMALADEFGPREGRGILESGDVITHVDGQPIRSESDFHRAMYLASGPLRQGRLTLQVRDVRTGRSVLWGTTAEKMIAPALVRVNPSPATRAKALLIGATDDTGWGRVARKNLEGMEVYLRGVLIDPETDLVVLDGKNVTAEGIMKTVARLPVAGTEALFCYITAHGAYDDRLGRGDPAGVHFFQLPGGDLMRKALLDALKAKGAQLTVLVSDTCNVAGPFLDGPRVAMPGAATEDGRPRYASRAFRELLYNHVGVVDVSGASRDQYGVGLTEHGGCFTVNFWRTIREMDWWNQRGAWEAFLRRASENTSDGYRYFRTNQLNAAQVNPPRSDDELQFLKVLEGQPDQRPQIFTFQVKEIRP
jgi:hypothetical protein